MAEANIRKYIITESVISMLFNAAFSFGFTYFIFSGQQFIPGSELIMDALPQSFFVTFFGALVPTLITRARLRAGKISPQPYRKNFLPDNALLRAINMGILVGIAGFACHFLLLTALAIDSLALSTTLAYKTIFGAILAWIVTPWALHISFTDGNAASACSVISSNAR